MIAEITFTDIWHWMPVISALIMIAFDWGVVMQKLKGFMTKYEVNKMLDEKLEGHCPNTMPIRNIDLKVQALETWKQEHTAWGAKSNEENHLVLQELRINMKRLCEHSGIDYLNGNNK